MLYAGTYLICENTDNLLSTIYISGIDLISLFSENDSNMVQSAANQIFSLVFENKNVSYMISLYPFFLCFRLKKGNYLYSTKVEQTKSAIYKDENDNKVGNSETTRIVNLNYNNKQNTLQSQHYFNTWLAGLIAGDGSIGVTQGKYLNLEITVDLNDIEMLNYVQNQLHAGSTKLRSGSNSYRFRIHNKKDMLMLINRINGLIPHSGRSKQLDRACELSNIQALPTTKPDIHSHYLAGMFDADGTITFSMKNNKPQLTVSVSNKLHTDLEMFVDLLGGYIYYDKGSGGSYKWSVQSKQDVLHVTDYFRYKCHSNKANRFFLVNKYYQLAELKAYNPDSPHNNAWTEFESKWRSYGAKARV